MEKKLVILLAATYSFQARADLTWTQVKAMAIDSAPDRKISNLNALVSDTEIENAESAFYPRIYSTFSAGKTIDTSVDKAANSYGAALTIEQSLFASGRDLARLKAARESKAATVASVNAGSITFRSRLAKAWNQALYQQKLVKITGQNISRRESNYQIVNLRYSGGRENKGSLLKTEAATLKAKLSSYEAKSKAEISKSELARLIGRDLPSDVTLAGDLGMSLSLPPDTMQDLAHSQNPTIDERAAKARAAQAQIESARAKYFPEISLTASARKSANPDLPLQSPVYSAGLTLTVPIFNAATSPEVRAASIKSAVATLELNEVQSAAAQNLKVRVTALEIARKALEISQKTLAAASLQAEVSRQRYTLGLISFQDWDSYESQLIDSEVDVLTTEHVLADALADYQEALGLRLEEGP